MTDNQDNLIKAIDLARKDIRTSSVQYSIGELISLYEIGDLRIKPVYQRLFRWKGEDSSRFIESLLLGMPTPAIFTETDDDGVWSLLDGLQRFSTILYFCGKLDSPKKGKGEYLELVGLEELDILNGRTFEALPKVTQREFLRTTITVNSIAKSEDKSLANKIFLRLNRAGKQLTAQETRNAVLSDSSPESYTKLDELASYQSFVDVMLFKEDDIEEAKPLESVLLYFYLRSILKNNMTALEIQKKRKTLSSLLDDFAFSLFPEIITLEEILLFKKVFDQIASLEGGLCTYSDATGKYRYFVATPTFYVLPLVLSIVIEKEHTKHSFESLRAMYWKKPFDTKGVSSATILTKAIEQIRQIEQSL
jgi:hypothetical protein